MPILDFIKNLTQRQKTKTKERSDDGKYITKTKEVKMPLEGDMTKVVTKKVKRPTLLGGADGKKEVTRSVRYESNSPSKSEKEIAGESKEKLIGNIGSAIGNAYESAISDMKKGHSAEEIKNMLDNKNETAKTKDVDKVKKSNNNKK